MNKNDIYKSLIDSINNNKEPVARIHAMDLLCEEFPDQFLSVIISSFSSEQSARVRARALKLLGKYKAPEVIEILLKAVEDSDKKVKTTAKSVLNKREIIKYMKTLKGPEKK